MMEGYLENMSGTLTMLLSSALLHRNGLKQKWDTEPKTLIPDFCSCRACASGIANGISTKQIVWKEWPLKTRTVGMCRG